MEESTVSTLSTQGFLSIPGRDLPAELRCQIIEDLDMGSLVALMSVSRGSREAVKECVRRYKGDITWARLETLPNLVRVDGEIRVRNWDEAERVSLRIRGPLKLHIESEVNGMDSLSLIRVRRTLYPRSIVTVRSPTHTFSLGPSVAIFLHPEFLWPGWVKGRIDTFLPDNSRLDTVVSQLLEMPHVCPLGIVGLSFHNNLRFEQTGDLPLVSAIIASQAPNIHTVCLPFEVNDSHILHLLDTGRKNSRSETSNSCITTVRGFGNPTRGLFNPWDTLFAYHVHHTGMLSGLQHLRDVFVPLTEVITALTIFPNLLEIQVVCGLSALLDPEEVTPEDPAPITTDHLRNLEANHVFRLQTLFHRVSFHLFVSPQRYRPESEEEEDEEEESEEESDYSDEESE